MIVKRLVAVALQFLPRSANLLVSRGFESDASKTGDNIPYLLECEVDLLVSSHWSLDDWPLYIKSMTSTT